MSITRGVLAQSPEPEAHDKVLDINPYRIGIWNFFLFLGGGGVGRGEKKIGVSGENTLGARTRTNAKLIRHTPSLGIEPGQQWWEASALTTAPSLLPQMVYEQWISTI